jgi:hypothetical protein
MGRFGSFIRATQPGDLHAVSAIFQNFRRKSNVPFVGSYLLKMCDQVVALISSEHANTIVWNEGDEADCFLDTENDESDRLFAFEVAQTNEQEETVTFRPGFQVCLWALFIPTMNLSFVS